MWKRMGIAALITLAVTACGQANPPADQAALPGENPIEEADAKMKRTMTVETADGQRITFLLNDSPAADSLYAQLPASFPVENYSSNEKIFYPARRLDTEGSVKAVSGAAGTLAYYAPWGNVVMFYGPFRPNGELYELGQYLQGDLPVEALAGEVRVTRDGTE